MRKRLFILLTLISVLSITACSSIGTKKYTAEEYSTINMEGLNGYATVTASANEKLLDTIFYDILDDNAEMVEQIELELILQEIKYEVLSENNAQLSNGDKVEIELSYNEELAKKYKLEFVDTVFEYEVLGLKEATVINPFEGLEVEYHGISPKATLTFNKINCHEFINQNVNFKADKSTEIANGDTINVTYSHNSNLLEDNNIVFSQEDKEFNVSDLSIFPVTINDVDVSAIEEEFEEMVETQLIKNNINLESEHNLNKLVQGSGNAKWKINAIEKAVPVKKLYFYAKDINNRIVNNYLVIWETPMTIEKSKNGYFVDVYEVGEEITISHHTVTYVQNVAVDSSQQVITEYIDDYKSAYQLNSEYYKADVENDRLAQDIVNEWKSNNVEDYQITELE